MRVLGWSIGHVHESAEAYHHSRFIDSQGSKERSKRIYNACDNAYYLSNYSEGSGSRRL